jgi:hypothetical protein
MHESKSIDGRIGEHEIIYEEDNKMSKMKQSSLGLDNLGNASS